MSSVDEKAKDMKDVLSGDAKAKDMKDVPSGDEKDRDVKDVPSEDDEPARPLLFPGSFIGATNSSHHFPSYIVLSFNNVTGTGTAAMCTQKVFEVAGQRVSYGKSGLYFTREREIGVEIYHKLYTAQKQMESTIHTGPIKRKGGKKRKPLANLTLPRIQKLLPGVEVLRVTVRKFIRVGGFKCDVNEINALECNDPPESPSPASRFLSDLVSDSNLTLSKV